MNLKKSDKIIAVVAVVILIIAAIGVILYTDKEPEEVEPEKNKMLLFKVKEDTIKTLGFNEECSIKDKQPYTTSFDVETDNLKNVSIYVDYVDVDRGLLKFIKNFRANTLDVKILDEAGEEIDKITIKGTGNVTKDILSGSQLEFENIEAIDLADAVKRIEENMTLTDETEKYTIEVTIKYGEFRILKKYFERLKGDAFTLEITANHYVYSPVEIENSNGDDYEETNIQTSYSAISYVSTNYIGFH